ncbi:MAG: T9SS type A sorting domain-containing protein [Candidatus Delongbacteria bacterium]|jgi:hypothetical protein|nr:T9SS type A sorting domain-containing protein [Candidatus Delongbacteria bacterium]
MKYRLLVFSMLVFLIIPLSILKSETKTPYSGSVSSSFDKSSNGHGWYQGYNRKISWDAGGSMLGSIYRKLDDSTGIGTIGGMIGEWTGNDLNSFAQIIYNKSVFWGENPEGRYPFSCGFINGYHFGIFNDFYTYGAAMDPDSAPIFSVVDATLGYDNFSGSVGIVRDSLEYFVPNAWQGTGDVVYDLATGYYYWSQAWNQSLLSGSGAVISTVVGRSMTPADALSWEWSDYRDLTFDCLEHTNGLTSINKFSYSYCKDLYGNGTGYGIALAMANDVDDHVVLEGTGSSDSTNSFYDLNQRISYMYTTNWGGDDTSGDWSPNWVYDTSHGDKRLFRINPEDIFDWYGSTSTVVNFFNDTIEIVLDDPYISWSISSVATENNYVHILLKVFGDAINIMSLDKGNYYCLANNEDFIAGYYHVRGLITETGVVWSKANLVASLVGMDTEEIEYGNTLSIGYAGYGQIYATWLDRPVINPMLNEFPDPNTNYYDDGYFSFSCDDGDTWEIPTSEEAPGYGHIEVEFPEDPGHIYNLYYAMNVTNTQTLHEEGWSCSSTGKIENGQIEVYTAHQYYDVANPFADNIDNFYDYQQFLHAWKITGSISDGTGISAEHVSLVNDFELMQNYPNPFNPSTEIRFKIQNDSKVKLIVFNTKGETVVRLVEGKLQKGLHKVKFDGSKLNSGVYFYQLNVNGLKNTKKMVLAK